MSISRGEAARLSLIAASAGFGQSALLALVPIVSDRTGLGAAAIGAVACLGAAVFLIAAPLWGHHGAKWQLRPFFIGLAALMIGGQILFGAALSIGSLMPLAAFGLLALSRILYSLGAAGVMPHAQAAIVHRTGKKERPAALANLSAGLNIGRIAGSLVTLSAGIGIAAPVLTMILGPLLLFCTPNMAAYSPSLRSAHEGNGKSAVQAALPLLAVGFVLTFGFGQIQIVLGLFLQHRFGLDVAAAAALGGATYAAVAVAMIAIQILVVPRLAYRLGRNMRYGVAGFALGCLIVALAPSPWIVPVGAIVAAIGIAVATPAYTACLAQRTAAHHQAGAAGWLASTHAAGQGVGALCGGFAFLLWPALPFVMAAAIGCMTALLLLNLDEREGDHERAS